MAIIKQNSGDNSSNNNNNKNKTTTKVRVRLYASNLRNVAGLFKGKSDPYCIVTKLANTREEQPVILGKTETIKNSLNPRWIKSFVIDYKFGIATRINVGVYDEVRKKENDVCMGSALFEIGDILGSAQNIKAKRLKNSSGTLFVRVETYDNQGETEEEEDLTLNLSLQGIKIKDVDGFLKGKSDPFLEISSRLHNGNGGGGSSWQIIYRSEPIMNNLYPYFSDISLNMNQLCRRDYNRPILFTIYDWNKNGKHSYMGSFESSVNGILNSVDVHNSSNNNNNNSNSLPDNIARWKKIDLSSVKPFILQKKDHTYGHFIVTSAHISGGNKINSSYHSSHSFHSHYNDNNSNHRSSNISPAAGGDNYASSMSFFAVGTNVEVHGLQSTPQFNGRQGIVKRYLNDRNRYEIELRNTKELMNVKPINLTLTAAASCSSMPIPPPTPTSTSYTSGVTNGMNDMSLHNNVTPLQPPSSININNNNKSKPTFVDYISGGLELQMAIAIDFTASNGNPRTPGTLHYRHPHDPNALNDYEKALTAVVSIVGKYDTDHKFPVYGFGAKFNNDSTVRHCFQVGPEVECDGLSGVLDAYSSIFTNRPITMSEPTVFAEVIDLVSVLAQSKEQQQMSNNNNNNKQQQRQSYTILLILTDGAVSDIESTQQSIRNASIDSPLSIIIIGVGNADFTAMKFLDDCYDDDQQKQQQHGAAPPPRDICHFVELNKHLNNKQSLTQATLEEVPDQVVDYFYNVCGIRPLQQQQQPNSYERDASIPVDDNIIPDDHDENFDIDLSIDMTNGKEPILLNSRKGTFYDETSYGNASMYRKQQRHRHSKRNVINSRRRRWKKKSRIIHRI